MPEDRYNVPQEMKSLYKKAMKPVPVKDHKKKIMKHRNAIKEAYKAIEDKGANTYHDGKEILTDALIAYRKASGHAVDESEEGRHTIFSEVETLIKSYAEQANLSEGQIESKIKEGDISGILNALIENEKLKDVNGKPKYLVSKMLKELTAENRMHLAREHANMNPGREYTDGELNSMAGPGKLENIMVNHYSAGIENQIKAKEKKKKS